MTLLSLILPIYNVEKYLSVCLDSLLKQNIDESAYEIICVNDGSPDKCEQIILNYQKKHGNIRLINKENGGVSEARNAGLATAEGKYVWFIDPDDFIRPNCLKYVLNILDAEKADICNILYKSVPEETTLDDFKMEQYLSYSKKGLMQGSCWTHIVKREKAVMLDESLAYGEDYLWEFETCALVEQQILISPAIYFYRQRMNSAMHSFSKEKVRKHITDMYKLALRYQQLQNEDKYKCLSRNIQDRIGLCVQSIIVAMLKNGFSKVEIKNQIVALEQEKLYPYRPLWFLLKPKKSIKIYCLNLFLLPLCSKHFLDFLLNWGGRFKFDSKS